MEDGELEKRLKGLLSEIAPESEELTIDPALSLRDELDLDSVDFLNFIVLIHESFGVDIPETDYPRLTSLNDIVSYVQQAGNITSRKS